MGKLSHRKWFLEAKHFSNYDKKAHPRTFKSLQSTPDRGQSGGVGNVGMLKHSKSFVLMMQTSAWDAGGVASLLVRPVKIAM